MEEGFLHGLDLEFHEGLNVIIGPRGSGKTSVIELIRYGLGVQAYSQSFGERSREHALAILGPGQVILTAEDGGTEYIISRSADEAHIEPRIGYPVPIILSQNEIETIGLSEEGKLRLIDSFSKDPDRATAKVKSLFSEIKSLTSQLDTLGGEIEIIEEQVAALDGIDDEIAQVGAEQELITGTIEAIQPQQQDLVRFAEKTTMLSVREKVLERTGEAVGQWLHQLQGIIEFPPDIEEWPDSAGETDLLAEAREFLRKGIAHLSNAVNSVEKASASSHELAIEASEQRLEVDKKARELRKQVEEIKEGAGLIARRLADLLEKQGQRDALSKLRSEREAAFNRVKDQRSKKLNALDKNREDRFEGRVQIVEQLNQALGPDIEIHALRSALFSDYENAIIESLRGSGLRYSSLAPRLANSMSPRELTEAIEEGNSEAISSLAEIPWKRANKIVAFAKSSGLDRILTSNVDDGIRMSLLVGGQYIPTEIVSTGQRCTVILPILLVDNGRSLIIDQPEDHLDNAFIVDTVIKSMRNASRKNQIICSTHNPNIPVLGEASLVVLLESDGKRGFVRSANHLDHPSTVMAITDVMEGGREAFERRAEFYRLADENDGES